MKIDIFVQARIGSTRLPGKVLLPVLGKPLLEYLVERLKDVKEARECVILTTTQPLDDSIVSFCQQKQIPYYRGSEEDVLSRYYEVAQQRQPDAIVRITGDCPLIDPDIVDEVIRLYRESYPLYDYVTNSLKRTYPRGLDVEVFSFEALERAFHEGTLPEEREHVTPYLYRHPERFQIKNMASPVNLSRHRWTVDTPEDFILIRHIIENLYPTHPHFRLQDILNLLEEYPNWSQINAHIQQKSISNHEKLT